MRAPPTPCARCGAVMTKLSGLPACSVCGPSSHVASVPEQGREWTETFGGRRREPIYEGRERRNSVDDQEAASLFDEYDLEDGDGDDLHLLPEEEDE